MAGQTTNYLFDYPTSTDYVKDGATAIQTLATDVDTTLFTALGGAYPGLRLVKKQTIGSAVSSVTVTNAFSATYENYIVKISGGVASTDNEWIFQFTGITGNVYLNSLSYGLYSNSTPLWASQQNVTQWAWCGSNMTTNLNSHIELDSPFLSKAKSMRSSLAGISGGIVGRSTGFCNSTTSATGFTMTLNTGTATGGTIYVYGYGIS
jgi:hypothetical protein